MTRRGIAGLVCAAVMAMAAACTAQAEDNDRGRAFVPRPQSMPIYGVSEPDRTTGEQTHQVAVRDVAPETGTEIYTETYLPTAKDGHVPPQLVPQVLIYSPYESSGDEVTSVVLGGSARAYNADIARQLAARGYAVTIAHARGTGRSDGCVNFSGELERDDAARVIEYLGRDAPHTNGRVGMYGVSYGGAVELAVAARGDRERTKYLRAIVPSAAPADAYSIGLLDGVAYGFAGWPASAPVMLLFGAPESGVTDRAGCQVTDNVANTAVAGQSGDFVPFFQERDSREGVANVHVPVLATSGLLDLTVMPTSTIGFFDELPADTPKAIVVGQIPHGAPDNQPAPSALVPGVAPPMDMRRFDWFAMVVAWYDHWLKGLDTGADSWPVAQVQDQTGQWHADDDWPPRHGRTGELALGGPTPLAPDVNQLGATVPVGETAYPENSVHPDPTSADDRGQDAAIWETGELSRPLHITGQPTLDLWVKLDRDDAHIVANLQAFAKDGTPILTLASDGRRSMRHLDPIVAGRFTQAEGRAVEPGKEYPVHVRFWPVDAVIPKYAHLRLSLAGVSRTDSSEVQTSYPSGSGATITVLHDCAHPSVLRLTRPSQGSQLLNVRDREPADEALPSNPAPTPEDDGGGILDQPFCAGL